MKMKQMLRSGLMATLLLAAAAKPALAITVDSVSPDFGPEPGWTLVTIDGTGFAEGCIAYFDGNVANTTYWHSLLITATAPPGTGVVDVMVVNPDSSSDTLVSGYTYSPSPTISDVTPGNGPETGGTTVTITGTAFESLTEVYFDVYPATDVAVTGPTELTCTTPPGTGTVDVSVYNPLSYVNTLSSAFTYDVVPPPTVSGISPDHGPEAGGTTATITGTNFMGGATVTIDGTPATGVSVNSSTEIVCTTPSGTGTVTVVVQNADGDGGSLVGGFTYDPPPTVDSITPDHGPEAGGISVTITGTGFTMPCFAYFDGNIASTTYLGPTIISAWLPAGTGVVDVMVQNPDSSSDTLVDCFTYYPPATVSDVSPANGPETGGTPVTITGMDFVSGADVYFGGDWATDVVVTGSTEITCTTPPGTGTVDVDVYNPESAPGTLSSAFTYDVVPPPTVSGVSPDHGPASGGTTVTLTGTNFMSGATVTIDGTPATDVSVNSSTEIVCTTPSGTGMVTVRVWNADGDQDLLVNGFTYDPPPTVDSITPDHGPEPGGTTVTITGSDFVAGATVDIGGAAATGVSVNSATEIVCDTPPGSGLAGVSVTNPDGQIGTLSGNFTYDLPPTVGLATPDAGPAEGGTAVTITGTDFVSGATVTFGGAAATAVVVVNAGEITCDTPSGTGAVDIVVTNPDGQNDTLTGGFVYDDPIAQEEGGCLPGRGAPGCLPLALLALAALFWRRRCPQ